MMIMVTGLQYQCKDEKSLSETLAHLEEDSPEVCLVRKTTHDYGMVVEAKEHRKVMGMVGRFDLPDVLELMRMKGFAALKGHAGRVSHEGGWMMVDIDAPEDFLHLRSSMSKAWMELPMPDIPLITDIPQHSDLESCIAYLHAALNCPGEFDTETTVESVRDLIEMSRYDVSSETQQALKEFRQILDSSADSCLHELLNDLVHAINGMGGQKRLKEYEEVYWEKLLDSDEAMDMIHAWYSSFAYTHTDDLTLKEIQRRKLSDIELWMQSLPYDLYRDIDNVGKLLHLLLYKDIPYEKFRALISALIMRCHLLDELETVMEFSDDDDDDITDNDNSPLSSPEAWELWKKAQAEGWVDEKRQPKISQSKAAIMASVMADLLNMSPRWEPFETLWHISDLATKYSKSQNFSYYPDTMKAIRQKLSTS